jgi:hypothetical protein
LASNIASNKKPRSENGRKSMARGWWNGRKRPMADDLENLAKRLQEFIEAVGSKASGVGGQTQVGLPPRTKTPLEELYENCLGELTDAERDELDRIIEKMRRSRALASPPGAIVPPL